MNHYRSHKLLALLFSLTFLAAACSEAESTGPRIEKSGTREIYRFHDGFPHYVGHFEVEEVSRIANKAPTSITGLTWLGPSLFQTSDVNGQSTLSQVSAESGSIVRNATLPADEIGAGLTHYEGRLYQLVNETSQIRIYDSESLDELESLPLEGEGMGLCNSSDKFFVTSDGTSQLTIRNIETLTVESSFTVELNGNELTGLDELECIGDQVWATIDESDTSEGATTIIVINVDTREVEATVDASQIVPESLEDDASQSLSGVALRTDDQSLWVTGQQWPSTYQIRLVPVDVS